MPQRAISVSLGSSTRDKRVDLTLGGVSVRLEREGVDGDPRKARARFAELDGNVAALGVGGFELGVRPDTREYSLRAGQSLIGSIARTPVVDGRALRWIIERNIFHRLETKLPRFKRAFMVSGTDRFAMAQCVAAHADEVLYGDFMFTFGLPIPLRSLESLRRAATWVLPMARWLPARVLYPTGASQERIVPRYEKHFAAADLIAGDFHYIRRHLPDDLRDKTVLTNTTTEADVELLRGRGARALITTTPRVDGRSFGTNMIEAALTARAGFGRTLTDDELSVAVKECDLRPHYLELQ